jgi:hypothetical protein
MRAERVGSRAYDLTKDFLTLPGQNRFGRPLDPPRLPRPVKAFVDSDGHLTWTWYPQMEERMERDMLRPPDLQVVPARLCFDFAELAHASDEQIAAFAERWGPLNLELRAEEAIGGWRRYAVLADALLRFSAEQAVGGPGDDQDWRTICESTAAGELPRNRRNTRQQTEMVVFVVNAWFAEARGHRILNAVDGVPNIRPAASNLFGILITQIAHAIARTDQMAVCAGCKKTFLPKRPLSRGSRQYCSRCRKAKVPQRDASRDWRLKNKTRK